MAIDFNSSLIEIPRPSEMEDVRKAMVANAVSLIGISASDNLQKMKDILGPVNGNWDLKRPFRCYQKNGRWITEGVSTCGLVCRGLWRRMKIDMNALYFNYIFGSAISAERIFAIKNRSFLSMSPSSSLIPSPGDYLIIGNGLSTHALTCIGWNSDTMASVDAGQTDSKGLQCIKRRERKWIKKPDGIYLGDRKIVGWMNLSGLPFKNENIIVPEDWETVEITF
jgi:hypothetical protein